MPERIDSWWNSISLRTKMTWMSVFLLTLGLIAAGVGSMSVLRTYLTDEVDSKITSVISQLDSKIVNITETSTGVRCEVSTVPTEYYVSVVTDGGELLCSNKESPTQHPDPEQLRTAYLASKDVVFTVASAPAAGHWRLVALPVVDSIDGEVLVVGLDLKETDALIARYSAIFLFFGLTVLILGGALTRLLVTSTFTPLREVEATAARFAAGDFSQRLGGATPNTEVGRLNQSLNAMLSRIDRAFADRAKTIEQMRRFVGDASHELRTPLVSVRGYAELYRMGALTTPEEVAQAMERIEKEAIRMGELVTDLLELARIDEAKPLQLTAVDLVPLAKDAALDAMASSPDRTVTVVITEPVPASSTTADRSAPDVAGTRPATRTVALSYGPKALAGATIARLRALRTRAPKPALGNELGVPEAEPTVAVRAAIHAEENKIRQVLTNLMGNALRFSPAGSPIEIGIEVDEAGNRAILSVIDHGEGIPPQIREKIFQRFWRADSSRNRDTGGSGLGLAIVAAIVAAHKGEVRVVETPGGGATFQVLLPLLQSDEESAVNGSSAG